MTATSYFKAFAAKGVHEVYPFRDGDYASTADAYYAAKAAAAYNRGAEVSVWQRPSAPGPWSGVAVVGDGL